MFYTLSALLEILLVERADAIHLHPGEKPVVEMSRTLFRVSGPPTEPGDLETILRHIATKDRVSGNFDPPASFPVIIRFLAKGWFTFMAFREQNP